MAALSLSHTGPDSVGRSHEVSKDGAFRVRMVREGFEGSEWCQCCARDVRVQVSSASVQGVLVV